MPLTHRSTLTQFLIEERRRFPSASGDFNALILDVALACKAQAQVQPPSDGVGAVVAQALGVGHGDQE